MLIETKIGFENDLKYFLFRFYFPALSKEFKMQS